MGEIAATIVDSPGEGFPYLAIIVAPDGEVLAEVFMDTIEAAEEYVGRMHSELQIVAITSSEHHNRPVQ